MRSGLIIQMVGEGKKFGWGMFPTLIAKGPSKETPMLPEGEDIKNEVWSQLGRMEGHTNVISFNLFNLFMKLTSS